MATNLSIDPELLEKALQVSGEKTKKAAVTQALVEFIAKRERTRVKELFCQLDWDSDYNYKKSVRDSGSTGRYQRLVISNKRDKQPNSPALKIP